MIYFYQNFLIVVYCNFDYDKLSLAQRQGNVSDEIGNINMMAIVQNSIDSSFSKDELKLRECK